MQGSTSNPSSDPREITVYRGSPSASDSVLLLEPVGSEHVPRARDITGIEEAWQLIRNRAWIIVIFVIVGGLAGVVLTLQQSPTYRAQTAIEIQTPIDSPLGFQSATAGNGDTSPDSYLHTQVKILESRTLRNRVISRLTSTNHLSTYSTPGPWENLRMAFGGKTRPASSPARPHLPVFNIKVTSDATRIVELVCESPDPKFATDYVNTMADEYIQLQVESRWNASKRTTKWLSQQLDDMRQTLQASEDKLQAYNRSAGMLFGDELDTTAEEKLKQLQAELSQANADRVEKQSIFEIATSSPTETIPQVIDNTRLSGYQAKLAELRQELVELRSIYTPDHYKVVRVTAQIAELETTFKRERDSVIARIRNDYLAAVRREELLNASYRVQANLVSERASKLDTYNVLKREVDTDRQLYGALLQKIKESSVASAIAASNVSVLDAGILPSRPFAPKLSTNLAEGLGSGLFLGLALAILIDRMNRSLKSPGEAHLHLKVPELGVIPSSHLVAARKTEQPAKPLDFIARNGHVQGTDDAFELVTWQDSPSLAAESFRSVITSILLSNAAGQPPKSIVVTSVERQDGKSTTVSNLGLALAEIGKKVLLIDADMRKPRLHQIFDVPNTWGLSDLLRERSSLRDIPLEAMVRKTSIANNLYLLPSGPATLSISNLLYSERMMELLDRLRSEFATVLIDSPPVMYISDARVLGRLAGAAILVIRAGQTTRDAAVSTKQRLVDDGIAVLGTVLNRWEPKSKHQYENYYYNSRPQ